MVYSRSSCDKASLPPVTVLYSSRWRYRFLACFLYPCVAQIHTHTHSMYSILQDKLAAMARIQVRQCLMYFCGRVASNRELSTSGYLLALPECAPRRWHCVRKHHGQPSTCHTKAVSACCTHRLFCVPPCPPSTEQKMVGNSEDDAEVKALTIALVNGRIVDATIRY